MTDSRQTSPPGALSYLYSLMIQGKVWRMTLSVIGLSSRVHEDAPDPGNNTVTTGSYSGAVAWVGELLAG